MRPPLPRREIHRIRPPGRDTTAAASVFSPRIRGLGLWPRRRSRRAQPKLLTGTMARPALNGPGAGAALFVKSGGKERAHCCGNIRGVGLQRKVSGIEEAHDRTRNVAFERLGTLR